MQWGKQQEQAIKAATKWIAEKNAPPIFRLFGYAGTGKTTLAKEIAQHVNGLVLFACFTGKAALVLQNKGCPGASTIHSLIYKPVQDPVMGKVTFILNKDSMLSQAKLLVVDEVSMVGEEQAHDLLSFGVKILVLGDPAQLPPVKGEGFFINAEPNVMLTDIHRQAAENPIIRMSIDVREGRALRPGNYGDSVVIPRDKIDKDAMREIVLASDQMLCGMNRTRQLFNTRARELIGIEGDAATWHPQVGDKLICLRNNRLKGLLNGSLWKAQSVDPNNKLSTFDITMQSLDEPDAVPVDVTVPKEFFNGSEDKLDWRTKKAFDEVTFGNCITVHKSQGSQWDDLLLFDESHVFRASARNHLYTGLTRAAERITVVV